MFWFNGILSLNYCILGGYSYVIGACSYTQHGKSAVVNLTWVYKFTAVDAEVK